MHDHVELLIVRPMRWLNTILLSLLANLFGALPLPTMNVRSLATRRVASALQTPADSRRTASLFAILDQRLFRPARDDGIRRLRNAHAE